MGANQELLGPSPLDPRSLKAVKEALGVSSDLAGAITPSDDTGSVSDPIVMRRVAMAMLELDLNAEEGQDVPWQARANALEKQGVTVADYIGLCESPAYRVIAHRLQEAVIVENRRAGLLKTATQKALMGSSSELKALLSETETTGSSAADEVTRINQRGPDALRERFAELRERLRLLSQRAESRRPDEKIVRAANAVATARDDREIENARIDHRSLFDDR